MGGGLRAWCLMVFPAPLLWLLGPSCFLFKFLQSQFSPSPWAKAVAQCAASSPVLAWSPGENLFSLWCSSRITFMVKTWPVALYSLRSAFLPIISPEFADDSLVEVTVAVTLCHS